MRQNQPEQQRMRQNQPEQQRTRENQPEQQRTRENQPEQRRTRENQPEQQRTRQQTNQNLEKKLEPQKKLNVSRGNCENKNLNSENDEFLIGWDPTSLGFGSINYQLKRPNI
jgi:hypothetical protein